MHHDYPLSEMRRRLAMFVLIILLMAVTGSIGFVLLEGWSFAESLYMTVITLSTVGFAEVHPLHPGGRAFTTALIVAGIATVARGRNGRRPDESLCHRERTRPESRSVHRRAHERRIVRPQAAAGRSHPRHFTIHDQRPAHCRAIGVASATDFLDVVMHSGDLELWLEECRVSEESELQGKTVGEANVRQATGANVLAVRRGEGGAILTNPAPDMRFAAGDMLIALGTREQLKVLNRTAGFDA